MANNKIAAVEDDTNVTDTKNEPDNNENKDNEDKKEEETPPPPSVGFLEMWKYATTIENVCLIIAVLCALIQGATLPALMVGMGDLTDDLLHYGVVKYCNFSVADCTAVGFNLTQAEITKYSDIVGNGLIICYLMGLGGVVTLVLGSAHAAILNCTSTQVNIRLKQQFFKAVVRQDFKFFETETTPGDIGQKITTDLKDMKAGMNNRVSQAVSQVSQGLTGILIGFFYSWQLSLSIFILMALFPLLTMFGMEAAAEDASGELKSYTKASNIVNEALGAIRTITSFGGQKLEVLKYDTALVEAKRLSISNGWKMGISFGLEQFMIGSMYALTFSIGCYLYQRDLVTIGNLVTCFYGLIIGSFSLSQIGMNAEFFTKAQVAAFNIYKVIERESEIDPLSDSGKKLDSVKGNINIENVEFKYPLRDDLTALKDLNISIKSGETVAFVGLSGSGKSSIIKLIQRCYDPSSGSISLDGEDIKNINVASYRSKIGVVTQEPVLFNASIKDNISAGRTVGDASDEEIHAAIKSANAFNFINALPEKLETMVGDKGGFLSGGQKQRIAIARALINEPSILLLDEATSALDAESEQLVQDALDKAAINRTTIIIAHRLSTVKNADRIFGIKNGTVAEVGTHQELYNNKNGIYRALVDAQSDGNYQVAVKEEKLKRIESLENIKKTVSSKSIKPRDDELGEDKDALPEVPMSKIFSYNEPEFKVMVLGTICAFLAGTTDAIMALVFADVLTIFTDKTTMWDKLMPYVRLFFAVSIYGFTVHATKVISFSYSGAAITRRFRYLYFKALIKQDVEFFDDPKFPTSILASRLSADCRNVSLLTGSRLGTYCQASGSVIAAFIVGFIYSLKLALLCLAFLPFMAVAGYIELKDMVTKEEKDVKSSTVFGETCESIAIEVTNYISTVASLSRENYYIKKFNNLVNQDIKAEIKQSYVRGISFGFSQCVIFFAYAAVFRLGLSMVRDDEVEFHNVMKVLIAVIFGSMAAGQVIGFAPDSTVGFFAAKRLFYMLEKEPKMDVYSTDGFRPEMEGVVEFKNVSFSYPNRPEMPVLRGLNLTIKPGESVALVGQSGCGKSTVIQLLQRFYDVDEGEILYNGTNIKKINVTKLRQRMGFVQQEPVLFDRSIADNIRYGQAVELGNMFEENYPYYDSLIYDKTLFSENTPTDDSQFNDKMAKTYPISKVKECAENSNIDTFIETLPEAYDTIVGKGGSALSGGQKQRVAIARTLMKEPSILLLDEATSALDNESEKKINEALDQARIGKTVLLVAHRLSTVKTADKIICIDNGVVAETGTHKELIDRQGVYYNLVKAQI